MRSLSLLLLVCACSKGGDDKAAAGASKDKDVTVDELGVVLTVPGGWDLKKRGNDEIAITGGGLDGVILRKGGNVKTIEEAKGELISGSKYREEKALPTGGFFFAYDVDFGTKDKPMLLPHVSVVLPTATGSVHCTLQLQPSQDAAPIAKACSSMRKK